MTAGDVDNNRKVTYTRIDQGSPEEYRRVREFNLKMWRDNVGPRIITLLRSIASIPLLVQVNELEHSLQTATRCFRDDEDEETVVCALVHDIGEMYGPANHGEFAAAVLRPYVSAENYWMVKHHPEFQGYFYWHHSGRDRHARDTFLGHPCYERTVRFCERWDGPSFDPAYNWLPLEHFEPMVLRVFAREAFNAASESSVPAPNDGKKI